MKKMFTKKTNFLRRIFEILDEHVYIERQTL